MDRMLSAVRTETPNAGVRDAYSLVPTQEGASTGFEARNASRAWAFRENDVRAHWAPWGEGTDIAKWAEERGIDPFLVARKIAREGTEGNYIFARAWERYTPAMLQALSGGFGTWVKSYGTATQ
jgi:hypothetical protein